MDLSILKRLYESGYEFCQPRADDEKAFVIIIANHLDSFRRVFGHRLDDFNQVLVNVQSREELEIFGDPHSSLRTTMAFSKTLSADHEVLYQTCRKHVFTRLNKGADEGVLQSPGRLNGPVSLVIRRKNQSGEKYTSDAEDLANGRDAARKFGQMYVDGKTSLTNYRKP